MGSSCVAFLVRPFGCRLSFSFSFYSLHGACVYLAGNKECHKPIFGVATRDVPERQSRPGSQQVALIATGSRSARVVDKCLIKASGVQTILLVSVDRTSPLANASPGTVSAVVKRNDFRRFTPRPPDPRPSPPEAITHPFPLEPPVYPPNLVNARARARWLRSASAHRSAATVETDKEELVAERLHGSGYKGRKGRREVGRKELVVWGPSRDLIRMCRLFPYHQ